MEPYLEFVQHHVELFVAFGVVFLLFVANEVYGQLSGAARIAPLEAVRLINDRDALVVDVRPAPDYKKGHLMNALNLPLARLAERVSELPKDKSRPIILYCALGGTAVEAARTLTEQGYTEVYPIRGGLEGWLSANLPVTAK
jgi:rhodanese-related sulfurtransferase